MANSLGLTEKNITQDEIDALVKIFFAANMVNISAVELDEHFNSIPKTGSVVLKRLCGNLRALLDTRLTKAQEEEALLDALEKEVANERETH